MKAMKKVLFLALMLTLALTTVAFAANDYQLPVCPVCEGILEYVGDAKAPTCENAVTVELKCTKCNFKGEVTLEAIGHDIPLVEDNIVKTVASTCTTKGSVTYEDDCTECGLARVTKTVELPLVKHGDLLTAMAENEAIADLKILDAKTKLTYAQAEAVKASFDASLAATADTYKYERANLKTKLSKNTCVNANTLELYCSKCDYKVTWNIAGSADHAWEKINDKCQAPTCTEVGYDYFECKLCKGVNKVVEVAANGHSYNGEKWVLQNGKFLGDVTDPAFMDCTEAMWVKRCTTKGCGYYEKIEDIKIKTVHGSDEFFKLAAYSEVAPTCTETGKKFVQCPECQNIFEKTVDALKHDWKHVKYSVVPTCTTAGKEDQKCARCNATQTIDLVAPGHKYETEWVITNDCESDIYTIDICGYCGNKDLTSKKIIGKGHNPTEVRGIKNVILTSGSKLDFANYIPTTCGVEASVTFFCDRCKQNYTIDRTVAKCDFDYTAASNFLNGKDGVAAYAKEMKAYGELNQTCKNDIYWTVECFNAKLGQVAKCEKTEKVLVAEKCDCFGVRLDGTKNYRVMESVPGNCTSKAKEVRKCNTCGDVKTIELDYVHDLKLSGGKWICQRIGCDYTSDFEVAMKATIDTSKIVLTNNSCAGEASVKLEGVNGDVYARITATFTMSDGDKLTIVQAVKVTKSTDGKTGTFEIPSYQLPKGTLTNFFVTITPDSGSAAMPLGSVNKLAWVTLK